MAEKGGKTGWSRLGLIGVSVALTYLELRSFPRSFYVVSQPIDTIDQEDPRLENVEEWCPDINFLKIASNLVVSHHCPEWMLNSQFVEQWACPRLRESAELSWSLFIVSTLRHDPNAGVVGIDPHLADSYLLEAVNGDAFQFLRDLVTSIRQERGFEPKDEQQEAELDDIVRIASRTDSANDAFIFSQLQGILEMLSSKKHFLRNLRNREEDNSNRRPQAGSQNLTPSTHFSTFVLLVAAVFKTLPEDSAQYLWDDASFTGAVLDGRSSPSTAIWELLAVISVGPVCSIKAFERLQGTNASPLAALQFYQHYSNELPKLVESMKTNRAEKHGHRVREEDIQLGIGLSRVLAAVVKSSSAIRSRLLQTKPHPIQLLLEMLNCEWTVPMKAAVLDALTAFCAPRKDAADDDVFNRTVDHYDRISYPESNRVDPRAGQRPPEPHGWLKALESIEQDGSYPLTRAYIRFLTALLSGATSNLRIALLLRRAAEFVLRQLAFVAERPFARSSERWEMLDEALAFVEKALLGLDMTDLLAFHTASPSTVAWKLFDLPGFAVLLRMLENSDVKIFPLLAQVIDTVPTIPKSHITKSVQLRTLRIYYRILDIQLVFADILLPTLERPMPDKSARPWPFRRPVNLEPLDLRLLNHLSNVTVIALGMNDEDLAISLMCTKIISALAMSPHFNQSDRFVGDYHRSLNRLAGFIDASDDSIRIAQAVCVRLAGEGVDLPPDQVAKVEKEVLEGDISPDSLAGLPIVIRSTILDLLIDGTAPDASGPNIAHFLLGFELKGHHFTLQNPQEAESRYSCLQVILEQLRVDADVVEDANRARDSSLVAVHPMLAAKTVKLIHQLFSHPVTGQTTMSYATSIENFSASQLRVLPPKCPAYGDLESGGFKGQGIAQYPDVAIPTTADTLVAYLDYLRWVISCVALETHAFEGKAASVGIVAAELFGTAGEDEEPPIITQILDHIDLIWREEAGEARPLEYFAQYNFDLFKRPELDHYDVDSLRHALSAYIKQQAKTGSATNVQAMEEEADYLVHRLSMRNRETEINVAKGGLLSAWAETLKVALGRLFIAHVSEERQETVLFELLDALLSRIGRDVSAGVLDILAESVLVVMNELRAILSEYDGVNLPIDQLGNVLARMIDIVVRPGVTENTRGNLYAAISQYLSLLSVSPSIADDVSVAGASVAGSTLESSSATASLQRKTISIVGSRRERFLSVLCKDTMDVRDVWKTECFALLGALVGVCVTERDRQILSPLLKDGFLPLFVRDIKDREIALQECLSPEASKQSRL